MAARIRRRQQQQQPQQTNEYQNNEESDDDFGCNGQSINPIIELYPIKITNGIELYHFIVMKVCLLMSFMKLMMLFEGILFVKVNESSSICTLDNLEVFPLTPRYLSLFTISFFSSSVFIGKTATDRTQYNFQKSCPFFIAGLHTIILVMRRRYLFTIDDILVSIMFMTSLSLYLALEYKHPKVLQRTIPKKVANVTPEVRKQPPPTRQQQKVAKKEINIEQYEEIIESDDGNYGEESSSET